MSDLVTRAEVVKLARTLGAEPESLTQLEHLGHDSLRELRELIAADLFEASASRFERLAEASRIAPAGIASMVAERAIGPVISAQLAALVQPKRALAMATKMSIPFLTEVAVHLDPAHASEIVAGMPAKTAIGVGLRLIGRGDFITMARFVDHLSIEVLEEVEQAIDDDHALLKVGFYLESASTVDRVITVLPPARLARFIHLTVTGPTELRLAGLSLAGRVSDPVKRQLADLALGQESTEALLAMVDVAVDQGAVAELITMVGHVSSDLHARINDLLAHLSPDLLATVVHEALTGSLDSRVAALMLLERLEPQLRSPLIDLVLAEPIAVLHDLVVDAAEVGAVREMLLATTYMTAGQLDQAISSLLDYDPASVESLVSAGVRQRQWPLLADLIEAGGSELILRTLRSFSGPGAYSLA